MKYDFQIYSKSKQSQHVLMESELDTVFFQIYLMLYGCRDGFLARCEVYGELQATSRLSGMPDVSLTFANPSILNDVRFHPCVRFQPWESNQRLSFVPPDGSFKLMSYRCLLHLL